MSVNIQEEDGIDTLGTFLGLTWSTYVAMIIVVVVIVLMILGLTALYYIHKKHGNSRIVTIAMRYIHMPICSGHSDWCNTCCNNQVAQKNVNASMGQPPNYLEAIGIAPIKAPDGNRNVVAKEPMPGASQ